MTAKLYQFPSGKQLEGQATSGSFYVCAILVSFAIAALTIKHYSR